MPNFYNYTENGIVYSFDDVFVPAEAFRQGNLFNWGTNTFGNIGDNTVIQRSIPVTTFSGGANWKQVSTGQYHTTAIKTDGTLWGWGTGTQGQLGDNATVNRSTPVTTFAGGTNWKQVACGGNHTVAIKTDGTIWGWGRNYNGQLGDNTISQRNTPVTTFVGGTNWKQVACSSYFSISSTSAIKTDGTLWVWGSNINGQLGDNTTTQRITPVTTFLGGTNWKQVACGFFHTTAIKTDGTLWTWGRNIEGQLGDNTVTQKNTAVTTFAGGNNWKQVASGGYSNAAIKTDGTLWTWGRNNTGQLGDNTSGINRSTPVTTFAGGTNWKLVGTSYATISVKTDGTLWVWGANNSAQLGINNTASPICTPVTTFAGGTNWRQGTSGQGSSVVITYIDDYQ